MSWKRLMAFFSVTPMYCCCSGTGRKELSKKKRPLSGRTRSSVATSSKLGSVAEMPTMRVMSREDSTWRSARAMMASSTAPRSSWSRWISSMITRRTSCV